MGKSLKLIIEALLFASDKPLTPRDIHAVLPDVKLPDISSALRVLRYEYEALGRSFTLKEIADGYQFRSHSEYGPYILTLFQSSPNRLSRAAMETVAIIAYKQPVLRQEVERLRGVDSGGILKTLLERGLIRIMGRENLPGRPLIYGTTKKFLEVFDLKDLDSLPKLKEIKALGTDDYETTPTGEQATPETKTLREALEETIEKPGSGQGSGAPVSEPGASEGVAATEEANPESSD